MPFALLPSMLDAVMHPSARPHSLASWAASRATALGAHGAVRYGALGRFFDEDQLAVADARQEQTTAERGQG